MISVKNLIDNNSKLDIFNEIDKYIDSMPLYFIKDSYINNIVHHYNKFIKIISKAIGIDRYYKCKNDLTIYVKNVDNILIDKILDDNYFTRKARILIIYQLLKICKEYSMSFLDVFIILNFKFKWQKSHNEDVLCTNINTKIQDIYYLNQSALDEPANNILNNIYHETNIEISKILSNNKVCNNDIIKLFKYYITVVYIAFSIIGNKQKFSFNNTIIDNFKINNNIIDNILYKLNNKKCNNALITDLNNIAKKHNTSIIIIFALLICNNKYNSITGITKDLSNEVKSLVNMYIHEDLTDIMFNVTKSNIINIDNKENIINNVLEQNNLYYIKRDKFNIKYKRIYKCITVINNLDIAIMECVDNLGLTTQQYVLSEEDCNFLNIEYKDNLEVFSIKLNWVIK